MNASSALPRAAKRSRNPLHRAADLSNRLVHNYLPDPFVLAAIILVLVLLLAMAFTPSGPVELVGMFHRGMWQMLSFAMQLSLVVITGSALASVPWIHSSVRALARIPRGPVQATFLVAVVTGLIGFLNWGVALVVGIVYAKEVSRQVRGTHFPLLVAASYAGFTLWSLGLSSSIPLALNTEGHPLAEQIGLIGLRETILSPVSLVLAGVLLLVYAATAAAMTPRAADATSLPEEGNGQDSTADTATSAGPPVQRPLAVRLECSRVFSLVLGAIGLFSFVLIMISQGINGLTLNTVNLLIVSLGLSFYPGLTAYLKAAQQSAESIVPIIVLYPFYAGIAAIMTESGLGALATQALAGVTTAAVLPAVTFLAAGLINTVVPADGGHLVLQGPVFFDLAQQEGVSPGLTAVAMSLGANWSNMLQPFWALPALALARLGIRDIMGYCLVILVVSGIVSCALLLVLPLFL